MQTGVCVLYCSTEGMPSTRTGSRCPQDTALCCGSCPLYVMGAVHITETPAYGPVLPSWTDHSQYYFWVLCLYDISICTDLGSWLQAPNITVVCPHERCPVTFLEITYVPTQEVGVLNLKPVSTVRFWVRFASFRGKLVGDTRAVCAVDASKDILITAASQHDCRAAYRPY